MPGGIGLQLALLLWNLSRKMEHSHSIHFCSRLNVQKRDWNIKAGNIPDV